MTSDFIPKRPHKKSRSGCLTCKRKKIKCDELQPKCSFCKKRNLDCIFGASKSDSILSTGSITSGSLTKQSSPLGDDKADIKKVTLGLMNSSGPHIGVSSGLTSMDLRMMHYWSVSTSEGTVGDYAHDTLKIIVPQLAFEHDFLLNGVLGIASLHMLQSAPDSIHLEQQANLYKAKALRLYRQILTRIRPGTSEYEAAVVMAIFLVVMYSQEKALEADELIIIYWLVLYKGLGSIFQLDPLPKMEHLAVAPIFYRELTELQCPPVVPRVLLNMLQEVQKLDPDFEMLEFYCKMLDDLGLLYASLAQDGPSMNLFVRIISWPSYISPEFRECATQKRPRALIILAHYLVFIKLARHVWWLRGMADRDIKLIGKLIDPEWASYMTVPLQALKTTNDDELMSLLLSS